MQAPKELRKKTRRMDLKQMKTKNWKCLMGLGAAFSLPLLASANLVVDGDFSNPAVSPSANPNFNTIFSTDADPTIGAWKVTSGSVDLIGSYWQAPAGGQSVDMAGDASGTISQTLDLAPGTYKLTFDESGNPDGPPNLKQLGVTLDGASASAGTFAVGGTFNYTIGANSYSAMDYTLQTAYFTILGGPSVSLVFSDLSIGTGISNPVGSYGTTPWGAVLGNVSLTAVPESTTMIAGALLLLPFGASTLRISRGKRVG